MSRKSRQPSNDPSDTTQRSLFPDLAPDEGVPHPRKLTLDSQVSTTWQGSERETIEGIPPLILPTRWEYLQPRIKDDEVALRTIVRPIPQAMKVVRNIVEYLKTTVGCQVLVIRADTGSGKTTFLNTLPHYMPDEELHTQTIDLQSISEDSFGEALRKIPLSSHGINLIILEGREKPESISDRFIQIVLADINRFARAKRVPLLFVIPTIEDQVARNWCDHGVKIGDLIPEQKLYQGSRWYNFPGVAKEEYGEVAEETVRTLNPPHTLLDFGVGPDEISNWVNTAPTIGRFIEVLASRISDRRSAATMVTGGKREHVWVVYCAPDLRHYDHTYLVLHGLCQDEKMHVSPTKLFPPNSDTSTAKHWHDSSQWARLVATINFLDVRLVNLPTTAVVTAALAYGDDRLIQSFKSTSFRQYRSALEREFPTADVDWDKPLVERRLQTQNARDSIERSNLSLLLRGLPAEIQRGGNTETILGFAQYLHLREATHEQELHYFVGRALQDLLKYLQFPGFIGVETEKSLVVGQTDPVPDVTVHTESDTFALEFHFLRKQIAPSEAARYATRNVIEKYMRSLPHLHSILETIVT